MDSVDLERMEEAKMELMRTAKCPDNQGTPVLILANKQDLPGAKEPRELEKLLGLYELTPYIPSTSLSSTTLSSSSNNSNNTNNINSSEKTHSSSSNTTTTSSQSSSSIKTLDQSSLKLWHIQPGMIYLYLVHQI